jgi:hypothetical protein
MRWLYLVSIFAVLILLIGVDQCPMPGGTGTTGTSGQTKSGMDISLVQGVGYFKQGMQIQQGDTFRVLLSMVNYDKAEKKGTICIKDNQDEAYGGIPTSGQGLCSPYDVLGADYSGDKLLNPSSQTIVFPSDGEFSYNNIPITAPGKLFVTYSYVQNSVAQALVNVPIPEQETLSVSQPSAPILLSIDKTVSTQSGQYKVMFGITFSQSGAGTQIYSEDMRTGNVTRFTARLSPSASFSGYSMDCTQQNPGLINLASTKFIKCSALLPLETTVYPLLIYTDYGVGVTKTFDFTIAKEAT